MKILITAGDPSGDIHAARLMSELKSKQGDIEFLGFGGNNMIKQGLKSIAPFDQVAVVGFWEVFKRISFFRELLKKCRSIIDNGVDLYIPVDYPGFNIRLASYAKQKKVKVTYYIAPQLWAWGKDRARKLSESVDKLLVVFPFETDYFSKFGIETHYVGHPLLDDNAFANEIPNRESRIHQIAFLPGSREQEVIKHLNLIRGTAEEIQKITGINNFAIASSPNVPKSIYLKFLADNHGWVMTNDSKSLMMQSLVGVVKTGTSTLEAAICGMPFSMIYKTSNFTYLMGKKLINLEYISLVNILSNRHIVNEFIQSKANPQLIANDIADIINNPNIYDGIQNSFAEIRKNLGGTGASKRAADSILGK